MRVIAGTARSLPLRTVDGMETRPTTDRIKETLFNILQPYLSDCIFLDLFAGSGAIGIEALSRGARRAYFVEKMPAALRCIRENLTFTRLADRAEVIPGDVLAAFSQLEDNACAMDVIFMDPPYDRGLEQMALARLAASPLLTPDTIVIVEASLQTDFSYVHGLGYSVEREKNYKTNKHVFLKKDCVGEKS